MNFDEKGLASAELLFVTLIFLIIAGGMVNLANSEIGITQTGNLGEARMVGEKIAEAINTAYINGNGYAINLNLTNDINYTANINGSGYITMIYNGQSIGIKSMTVGNVTLANTTPIKSGTFHTITNVNGTIIIK